MKILHLNQRDDGGAGRAMVRLHQGLRLEGVDSQAFVQVKTSDDSNIFSPQHALGKLSAKLKLTEHLDNLPLQLYKNRAKGHFSVAYVPDSIPSVIESFNPDIVHLHWVNHGFVGIDSLRKFNKPIVWTMHDMWAFTGGCHYSEDCTKYTTSCGACPTLNSTNTNDLSARIWKRKKRVWKDVDMTVVTPSKWMANCAKDSSLLGQRRIEVIPNGLDTAAFKPIDRQLARHMLNLPFDKHLILFGAANPQDTRKGMHLLLPALRTLHTNGMNNKIELLIFGGTPTDSIQLDFKVNYLGRLNDTISLALAYSAADVFIAPSLEDNLPNTLVESLSCGTPGVAFNIGGIPDIIEHMHTGYLARPFEPDSLAEGIQWILTENLHDEQFRRRLSDKAKQMFGLRTQAQHYMSLYQEILTR